MSKPQSASLHDFHIVHRQHRRDFTTQYAEDFYRPILTKLYERFDEYNALFFEGELAVPYICLANLPSAKLWGAYRVSHVF